MGIRDQVHTILEQEYGLSRYSTKGGIKTRRINPGTKIGANVQFGENVIISEDVEIGDGVHIGNNVTLRNCSLGNNVSIEDNCIIGYQTLQGGFSRKLDGHTDIKPTIIGEGTLIRTGCVIYQSVTIGNHCWINHMVILREHTLIGQYTCIGTMSDSEGYNSIGNHVLIHSQIHMCAHMFIEDYVFIAPMSVFTNGNPMGYAREVDSTEQGPIIRFGTQIAVNSVVLPRIVIGFEAIIGASAVVTRDVPDLSVVMGVPGKVVGRVPDHLRMPEAIRRQYYNGNLDP